MRHGAMTVILLCSILVTACTKAECEPGFQVADGANEGSSRSGLELCGGTWFRKDAVACDDTGGECRTDGDCGDGEACLCSSANQSWVDEEAEDASEFLSSASQCIRAECRVDADCGSGRCGLSLRSEGCANDIAGLFCQGFGDACAMDDDCRGKDRCVVEARGEPWECVEYRFCVE